MKLRDVLHWPMKAIFWPPSLVLRQFGSAAYFSYLVGWRRFPSWVLRHGINSLPIAAGATGMGCIGYPGHPAWEVTSACNLRCIHCHVTADTPGPDELNTDEAKGFIDDLARIDGFRMLVYTGGEPLVRKDIFALMHHSKEAGLINVIATNGTLITEETAFRLKEEGLACAAVSLDSWRDEVHDFVRNRQNTYGLAMRGIRALKKAGIPLQINCTAMQYNFDDLDELLDLVDGLGSGIMLMYQLVPVGRGDDIRDATLSVNENERLLKFLAKKQKDVSTIVEPVAGPQYWPYLMERKGLKNGTWLRVAEQVFHGCAAGRGFVYIKANGDVWPCPFVEVIAGNVKERPFDRIWEDSPVFAALRNRENTLKGRCGDCRYRAMCGGCRGRAMACTGDYLAEDPSCFLEDSLIDRAGPVRSSGRAPRSGRVSG
ncbi:MAG TPA: radical SAM protein [Deltaproteobacteria bacterium]|nr:radical SAM protein [Deltaproteobacteria bacterium]HQI81420.1 radical SAM protein [Deltaproteobacteria bacterium]